MKNKDLFYLDYDLKLVYNFIIKKEEKDINLYPIEKDIIASRYKSRNTPHIPSVIHFPGVGIQTNIYQIGLEII